MGRRTLLRGLTLAVAAVLPLYGPTAVHAAQTATATTATAAATAVAVCGHTGEQPTLRQGSTGDPTVEAQCELDLATKPSRYTPIAADGSFGPATETRVKEFQACAGLSADGVLGPQTWAALNTWAAAPHTCPTQGTSATAQAAVCGHTDTRPTLRKGANGVEVKELQCRLNLAMEPFHYPPLTIDGDFGGGTEGRVVELQHCAGLSADGVVGPNTWAKLADWSGRNTYCTPPRPAGYPVDGLDTAKYQHPGGAPIDWKAVRASGVEFATIKATRGLNVTDEYLATDLPAARAAGLAVAPYHFYTGTAADTGGAQADRFIAAVRATGYTGQRAGDLPPVFDLERMDDGTGRCPTYGTVADAKAWLDKVEAAFGRTPVIYTQKSFLDDCLGSTTAFARYPLQLADYRQSITQPPLPNGSTTWAMWQYTDAALFPGIKAPATADVFNGTQADLDRLANRTGTATASVVAAAATTCYGGAVTVRYGDVLDFGPYWTTSRCTDINMRVTGGTADYVNACVKFAKTGTCNRWTKVGRSWTTIATDVLDGTKFTVPNGVPLEGDDAVMQIAF
ncbi:GH25 family lysozyme [Streptomyces sp. Ag109_O5-10]|uniref:GH25 family lysozyme n=1 Tax=Streptomyces sp. Ag109_O5-10 TaxID=1855349 RepID=UPI00089A1184|nr:GH25 family lysozyme [Streptomyces sp. Ag109_O5-10]SEF07395.1 lysozyme [Streptomyces sp. Ag109_O5-10]